MYIVVQLLSLFWLTLCNLVDFSTAGSPVPPLFPGVCSNSCPLSWWCHPTISSCHPLLLLHLVLPSISGEGNGIPLQYSCLGKWTEKSGRLQSMGSLRVGHDWVTSLSLFTFMHWRRKWQPTPVFLPGETQGRGSLVGCCPWGRTASDMTKAT